MTQVVGILSHGKKELHNQYRGCWCPGNARSQGMSNHDIAYVEPE